MGKVVHRVVRIRHRAVTLCPARLQPQPGHPLLAGLNQIKPSTGHRHGEAADLPHRLGDAFEQLGPVLHQPMRSQEAAGFLVGRERQGDRAIRDRSRALAGADHRQQDGVEVLHVDGAAAVQVAVDDLGGERVDSPLLGECRYDVEVPVQQQPRPAIRCAPRCTPLGDDARPARFGLDDQGLNTHLGQLGRDVLSRRTLPRPGAIAVVGRVDPNEITADLDDLGVRDVCHTASLRGTWP